MITAASLVAFVLVPQGVAAASPSQDVRTVVKIARPASAAEAARLDGHGCSGDEVSNNGYVHVCFVRAGDTIWVRDDEANGRSAVGQLDFYDAGTRYYGYCLNPHSHASGIWVYCRFPEADENTTAYYRGYDTVGDSVGHFTPWQGESTS
jgi:hypothetical protein